MRILHTADVHLDSPMTANLSEDKARERRAELLTCFSDMVKWADENGAEVFLIAGDLFDSGTVKKTPANAVAGIISKYPGIKFFYLRGNHDRKDVFSETKDMPGNFYTFSDEWTTYRLGEGVALTGIELLGRTSRDVSSQLALDASDINIVTMHGTLSTKRAAKEKEEILIKDLKNKSIDYLALGHIHSFKDDRLDERGWAVYSGCPAGRGFEESETGEKGFAVIDIDEKTRDITYRFVGLPGRRIYRPAVDVTGCDDSQEAYYRIREALGDRFDKSSMLEVQMTGEISVEGEMDTVYIEKLMEDEYFCFKIKDLTKPYIDYSEYEMDKTLKGEFIRTVKGAPELSDEDRAEIIKIGIAAFRGEEI